MRQLHGTWWKVLCGLLTVAAVLFIITCALILASDDASELELHPQVKLKHELPRAEVQTNAGESIESSESAEAAESQASPWEGEEWAGGDFIGVEQADCSPHHHDAVISGRWPSNPCVTSSTLPGRCVPNFINIGVDRSGSSSMAVNLGCHPEIASHRAEANGLKRASMAKGIDWGSLTKSFPPVTPEESAANQIIVGTKTPGLWMMDGNVFKKHLPDALLFIGLRHPLEHILATFWHGTSKKVTDRAKFNGQFADHVRKGVQGATGCGQGDWDALYECVTAQEFISARYLPKSGSPEGLHILAVPAQLRAFERAGYVVGDTLGVFFAEEFFADPVTYTQNVMAFLGKNGTVPGVAECVEDVGLVNENARANFDEDLLSLWQSDIPPGALKLLTWLSRRCEEDLGSMVEIPLCWDDLYMLKSIR